MTISHVSVKQCSACTAIDIALGTAVESLSGLETHFLLQLNMLMAWYGNLLPVSYSINDGSQ